MATETDAAGGWFCCFYRDYGDFLRQVSQVLETALAANHKVLCCVRKSLAGHLAMRYVRSSQRPIFVSARELKWWYEGMMRGAQWLPRRAVAETSSTKPAAVTMIEDSSYVGPASVLAAAGRVNGKRSGVPGFYFCFLAVTDHAGLALLTDTASCLDLRPALYMDRDSWNVSVQGRRIQLSPAEFAILWRLARHPGRVVSREELSGWAFGDPAGTGSVAAHIYKLRRKIEVDPAHPTLIKTVRGLGYRLQLPLPSRNGNVDI
ncbi:MAG: winged helix-turn-helix domain-containing protein [Bacillota bacterium]